MPPSIEKIAIWILEVLEEERQREPDWLKCRPASHVLGLLKTKHDLKDADITRGLNFCIERQYIKILNREDGQALLPSDAGIRMFAQIELHRLDEAKAETATRKADTERRQDVRLRIYPIIISILGLVIAILAYKLWK